MAAGGREGELRKLPAVDRVMDVLGEPGASTASAARASVDAARGAVLAGAAAPTLSEIAADARSRLEALQRTQLSPVINATGVLIHTNLGRVPLARGQLEHVVEVASSYSNLEYRVDEGERGSRYDHAAAALARTTGAEAALVVNNNAAAVLLVMTLFRGRSVVVSRGELVEIGGEFRIPDVMELSGARLVEVGTTNRTHLADYERAIERDTGALLKVHPSNYRIVGFSSSVDARDVARLARGRGLCFVHDLGSGLLEGDELEWLYDEPDVRRSLREGADLVTFSGDKLLGGPQAGVIAGRAELIEKLRREPLLRALRPDKMTLAALEATLLMYEGGRAEELPLRRMATTSVAELRDRAGAIVAALAHQAHLKAEVRDLKSVAGGGAAPERTLPSCGIALDHAEMGAADLHRVLRTGPARLVGRIEDDVVLLDLRTVFPHQDPEVIEALRDL